MYVAALVVGLATLVENFGGRSVAGGNHGEGGGADKGW